MSKGVSSKAVGYRIYQPRRNIGAADDFLERAGLRGIGRKPEELLNVTLYNDKEGPGLGVENEKKAKPWGFAFFCWPNNVKDLASGLDPIFPLEGYCDEKAYSRPEIVVTGLPPFVAGSNRIFAAAFIADSLQPIFHFERGISEIVRPSA